MTTHHTFCELRFGDNIAHLLLLRRLAKLHPSHSFIHFARPEYLSWLSEVTEDLPNIRLLPPPNKPPAGAINVWKGHEHHWYNHPKRYDYVAYYIEWYALCAERMGLGSPIRTPEDFLFDYPALAKPNALTRGICDFLLVNHRPMSGQLCGYDATGFSELADDLAAEGYSVIVTSPAGNHRCTETHGLSASGIGAVAAHATNIIMVSTGPSWPTFNVWAKPDLRVILLDNEQVNIQPNTLHCADIQGVRVTLRTKGLL